MSVAEIVFYGFSHTLLKKMYSIPSHYGYSSVFNLRLSLTSFEGLQLFKHCIKTIYTQYLLMNGKSFLNVG